MAINYPNGLDILTNPQPLDKQSEVQHSLQHQIANDILELLEEKVGINNDTNIAYFTLSHSLDHSILLSYSTFKIFASATSLTGGISLFFIVMHSSSYGPAYTVCFIISFGICDFTLPKVVCGDDCSIDR